MKKNITVKDFLKNVKKQENQLNICPQCNGKGGKYINRRFGCFESEEYLSCTKCGK